MKKVGLLTLLALVVGACTSGDTDASTSVAVIQPSSTTAATTPESIDPFHLFRGQGYDLEVFRQGLIVAERGVVDGIYESSPLYEADLTIRPDLTGFDGSYAVRYVNTEDHPLDEVVFRLFPNVSDGLTEVIDPRVDDSPIDFPATSATTRGVQDRTRLVVAAGWASMATNCAPWVTA